MKKSSIGIRNESSLHKTLKFQYAASAKKTEVAVGEYVADAISEDGEFIEVQTGSFAPLEKKVKELAAIGKVRIIHPVVVTKTLETYDANGDFLYRRKSNLHGSIWNIFNPLLHAPLLPLVKNVKIELAMIDTTERRVRDGKGSWRRKGVSIQDKQLSAWHERVLFAKKSDYLCFIPFKKGEKFTVSSLAHREGLKTVIARKALYVLAKMKLVKRIGKDGRAWVYIR